MIYVRANPRRHSAAPAQIENPSRTILIGIILAIATAIVGFVVSLLQDQRKREIDFVDLQIEKLYGPLFALSNATLRAKNDLIAERRPGIKEYFDPHHPPSKADVLMFRLWMRIVFQPMNLEMETAITHNAQLIQGGHIYPVFEEFIMHVESYKATMAKWKDSDAEENPHFLEGLENKAKKDFPDGFDVCVQKRYDAMLARRDHFRNFWVSTFTTYKGDPIFPADCDVPAAKVAQNN
jgi:hypothetical protein